MWKWDQILAWKRNKMAANLDLFRMHLHRQPNANTKLDLRSPIVDRNNATTGIIMIPYCIRRRKNALLMRTWVVIVWDNVAVDGWILGPGFKPEIKSWPSKEHISCKFFKRLGEFWMYFPQKWLSIGRLDALLAKTLLGTCIWHPLHIFLQGQTTSQGRESLRDQDHWMHFLIFDYC